MVRTKLCKSCGSNDLQYESHTPDWKREMYRCFQCGTENYFKVTVKTLQQIQEENIIDLYSVWGKENSK